MKNLKVLCAFILSGVILFVGSVHAEISEEDYARLRLVYTDARISVMTEEEIAEKLTYDLENAIHDSIYYKGISYNNGSYTWTEVSESEYDSGETEVMPMGISYETNYKYIDIAATSATGSNSYSISLYVTWKMIPTVRSFDVIAMRFRNVAILEGSQSGTQVYKLKGENGYSLIGYSPDGTNINKQYDGFGISMNLIDNSIDDIELHLEAIGMPSGSFPHVWGAYQHAVRNVTLAQSKSYTISNAGYGNVVNFSTSVQNNYDGMKGVQFAING